MFLIDPINSEDAPVMRILFFSDSLVLQSIMESYLAVCSASDDVRAFGTVFQLVYETFVRLV